MYNSMVMFLNWGWVFIVDFLWNIYQDKDKEYDTEEHGVGRIYVVVWNRMLDESGIRKDY